MRWTESGQPVALGTVPDATDTFSRAVTDDGQVIAGDAYFRGVNAITHAFRWTMTGGMVDLGLVTGSRHTQVLGINDRGSAIVGEASGFAEYAHAFLWTEDLGLVDLNTYLPSLGLDLSNWTLTRAISVSDDGRTLVGWGTFDPVPGPGGAIGLGWVITIPAPASTALAAIGLASLARRRRL